MSNNKTKGSFYQVLTSLAVVTKDLYRKVPILFYGLISIICLGFYGISNSPSVVLAIMSTLVGFLSIGVYFKNKSFSESILAFFLGLLTVFSITWNKTNTLVFSTVFLSFCTIYFLIASIKAYADIESIITQAAGFLPTISSDRAERFVKLKAIADQSTPNNNLNSIDRAKTVRLLAFIKIPLDQMPIAIQSIEMIKMVYEIPLEEAHKFYRSIYLIQKRINNRDVNYFDINNMFLTIIDLPLTPEDFFHIFHATKKIIIRNSIDFELYLDKLRDLVEAGFDNENIIEQINNI